MARTGKLVELRTLSGDPVTAGGITVIPEAQALIVHLPFGGFVWNRPVAVLVEKQHEVERIPIINVTRVVQLCLLICSLSMMAISMSLLTRRKEQTNGR